MRAAFAAFTRSCARANCSVLPAVLFLGLVLVAFIAAHRSGVRESILVAAVAVAGLTVLALAAAIVRSVARSRRPAAAARQRQPAMVQPVIRRAPAARPAIREPARLCVCGQPAVTAIEGQPACGQCAADSEAVAAAGEQPASLCGSCNSRPAVTDRAGWELCQSCAGKVDAAAAHAHEVAGARLAELAAGREYALSQPPVIPAGETIGTVDMSAYEEDAKP